LLFHSIREPLVRQPTDNLILHTLLRHAASEPQAKKAFYTENKRDFSSEEPRNALRGSNVLLHGRYESAVDWMTHADRS
jgi:hypothetical protein